MTGFPHNHSAPDRFGPDRFDPDRFDPDRFDDELRTHLHSVVAGVRPSGDALDHIRTAIPVRRRRRQVAAATLAVVLIGGGSAAALTTAGTGSSGSPVGGTLPAGNGGTSSDGDHDSQSPQSSWGTGGRSPRDHVPGSVAPGGTTTPGSGPEASQRPGGAGPVPTGPAAAPQPCAPSTLKQVTQPPPTGASPAYGSIRVTTTSPVPCTIPAPPTVHATDGAGDGATTTVVTPTSPPTTQQVLTPSATTAAITLPAHGTYQIRFAWTAGSSTASGAPCTRASGSATAPTWTLTYAVAAGGTPSPAATTVATVALPAACGTPTLYVANPEPVATAASSAPTG